LRNFVSKITAITLLLALWSNLEPGAQAQELALRIERYLNAQAVENGFSGQVLIAHGDEVLVNKSFVPPSRSGSQFGHARDRFPAGSVAEQFMAAAILQLELAGQVRLDSSICDYVSNCPGAWQQIHILHLLTHSSGLPGLNGTSPCLERVAPKPALLAMLSEKPLLFAPGDRFNLSNLDYFLLSLAIEKISGQLTNEYLDQHIFHPLKLAQTGYWVPTSRKKVAAIQTQTGCSQGKLPASLVLSSFSDQLYTSINDLYRWNHALATDEFLPKNSRDRMYTPFIEGHGFGWKILKEFDRKVAVQSNESDSSSVSIRMYPDDDTYIIAVSRVHQAAASELTHEVGALMFGKHARISSTPGAAQH
jgi:CubicO group peptidase (beta-lactamase class C family)